MGDADEAQKSGHVIIPFGRNGSDMKSTSGSWRGKLSESRNRISSNKENNIAKDSS